MWHKMNSDIPLWRCQLIGPIVNNIAGTAICFFVPATHFLRVLKNTLMYYRRIPESLRFPQVLLLFLTSAEQQ